MGNARGAGCWPPRMKRRCNGGGERRHGWRRARPRRLGARYNRSKSTGFSQMVQSTGSAMRASAGIGQRSCSNAPCCLREMQSGEVQGSTYSPDAAGWLRRSGYRTRLRLSPLLVQEDPCIPLIIFEKRYNDAVDFGALIPHSEASTDNDSRRRRSRSSRCVERIIAQQQTFPGLAVRERKK